MPAPVPRVGAYVQKPPVLQAVEAPGAITQVARLDQADQIREAIAFVTGTSEDEVEIEVETVLPNEILAEIAKAEQLREESQAANREAAARSRFAARAARHPWLVGT